MGIASISRCKEDEVLQYLRAKGAEGCLISTDGSGALLARVSKLGLKETEKASPVNTYCNLPHPLKCLEYGVMI
jgi:hypothetical protein